MGLANNTLFKQGSTMAAVRLIRPAARIVAVLNSGTRYIVQPAAP